MMLIRIKEKANYHIRPSLINPFMILWIALFAEQVTTLVKYEIEWIIYSHPYKYLFT